MLKKGETTVELERDRIEYAREYGALKNVQGMLDKIRRSKEK